MKILTRPVIVLLALWCTAVLLVPSGLAAEQGQGIMQAPGGSAPHLPDDQSNNNQILTPSFGGNKDPAQQHALENDDKHQMQGQPDGNTTAPVQYGSMNGEDNKSHRDFGNRTPPDFGNMVPFESGNFTSGESGNMTPRIKHELGNAGNNTFTPIQGNNQSMKMPDDQLVNNELKQTTANFAERERQQQSVEDPINGILSQLQALLSGKK
jgi:hypothetical protein